MAEKNSWIREEARGKFQTALMESGEKKIPDKGEKHAPFIRIITDPQLKQMKHQKMVKNFLAEKGSILITGNVKEGSFSESLLEEKMAVYLPYPHHQNMDEARALCEKNDFKTVIYHHNSERKMSIRQG